MEQKPTPMRARPLSRLLRPTAPPVALEVAIAASFIAVESPMVVLPAPRRKRLRATVSAGGRAAPQRRA